IVLNWIQGTKDWSVLLWNCCAEIMRVTESEEWPKGLVLEMRPGEDGKKKAVRCPPPKVPENGRLVEDENGGEYGVGSVVQFSCEVRHSLLGEGSIVCTDSGEWSQPPPTCRAHCDYPGEPANGRIVPLKFTYEPGDRLKVTCHPGFVTRLEAKPVCKADGTWSQPIPECRNYRDV
ncbi:hypothetical protein GE061_003850, partial [Apolygus lucorum]